jgi:adenylate kinase
VKDIVLFGMQGSGKGTQASLFVERHNFLLFEAGAELRKVMKEKSDLGKTVKSIVERGELVTNEIVMKIVEEFLNRTTNKTRILFDGIPRSIEQKETFDALLKKKERDIHGAFIDVDREICIERMKGRGRSDDTQEVIERRLKNYELETLPVILKYKEEGKMISVNGGQAVERVHQELLEKFDEIRTK